MNFETMALESVSITEYMEMIRQKTAVLLAGALKIGALYAGAPEKEVEKLYAFGIHLGLAFQLQDDLLDGYGDSAVFGKKTGQDIRDNKKSYLPLLALTVSSQGQQKELSQLFSSKDNMDEEEKVCRVMEIYNTIGLREKVERSIADEFALAKKSLDDIHADETLKTPFRELMDTLNGRKK